MKAATGELNLTVITIVAIAVVIAFFTSVLWPSISQSINKQWGNVDKCYDSYGNVTECG